MKIKSSFLISIFINTDIQVFKDILSTIAKNNNYSFKEAYNEFVYITKFC
jgi:hypothetical protein